MAARKRAHKAADAEMPSDFNGEMCASECMDELKRIGTSMAVGAAANAGVASIPGATAALSVGGVAVLPLAGAIVASMTAVALLDGMKNWVYRDAQVAEKRALEVERQCAEACRQLENYRRQIDDYLMASNAEFCRFMASSLAKIDSTDFETSLAGANEISPPAVPVPSYRQPMTLMPSCPTRSRSENESPGDRPSLLGDKPLGVMLPSRSHDKLSVLAKTENRPLGDRRQPTSQF